MRVHYQYIVVRGGGVQPVRSCSNRLAHYVTALERKFATINTQYITTDSPPKSLRCSQLSSSNERAAALAAAAIRFPTVIKSLWRRPLNVSQWPYQLSYQLYIYKNTPVRTHRERVGAEPALGTEFNDAQQLVPCRVDTDTAGPMCVRVCVPRRAQPSVSPTCTCINVYADCPNTPPRAATLAKTACASDGIPHYLMRSSAHWVVHTSERNKFINHPQ